MVVLEPQIPELELSIWYVLSCRLVSLLILFMCNYFAAPNPERTLLDDACRSSNSRSYIEEMLLPYPQLQKLRGYAA
jgi:hypothetical protein